MERLTNPEIDYSAVGVVDEMRTGTIAGMLCRLAAYEDTGLEPEEVKEITSWSYGPFHKKMGDWLKAEHEGRLIVLPCKVGDTVYTFYNGKNCKWPTNMKRRKIYETLVSGIRLHDWDADDWRLLLLFDTREASGCYEFSFSEVGKTVFLTSAKAEKAMEVSEDA